MGNSRENAVVVPHSVASPVPMEIYPHCMSNVRFKEPPSSFISPPKNWYEPYLTDVLQRTKRQARAQTAVATAPTHTKVKIETELGGILSRLKQTMTMPKVNSAPVVLSSVPATAKKQKGLFTPSKPKLDKPGDEKVQGHYMRDHIDTVLMIEKMGANVVETQESAIDWISGWINSLSEKMIKHIHEAAKKFQDRNMWSMLAKIASGILAAISVVFGASLIVSPAGGILVGGLLIASGILSIVNLVFEETKVWDWVADQIAGSDKKLRNQLRALIPAGASMISMGAGAAGSFGALFMESFNMVQTMLLMGHTVTEIGKNISSLAEGVNHSDYLKAKAETERVQTQMDLSDGQLGSTLSTLRQITKAVQFCFTSTFDSLTYYKRALSNIQG